MPEEAKPKTVYVGTEQAPSFYANQINVAVSPHDMRIRFALLDDATADAFVYRNLVTVYLAPGQARALRELLNRKSEDYERIWAQPVNLNFPEETQD